MINKRFKALAQCQPAKQETMIKLIDAVIVKHRVESAIRPVDREKSY